MTSISRASLFEKAWAQPLTKVAAEFGVTSTALKKTCDRHDIPTPGRGYWAAVASGKTFPRPKLRPVKDARLETVHIAGAPPLPDAVIAAMEQARETVPAPPAKVRQSPRKVAPAPADPPDKPVAVEGADAAVAAPPERRELAATRKALARARPDGSGFVSIAGKAVVSCHVGAASQDTVLGFLGALLDAAEPRGWALSATDTGTRLSVEGEALAFRLDERSQKTPHTPTDKELAEKARRLRWGDERDPWPDWDLSPSGRLALIVEENEWSGLRRTFSARKGHPLAESLDGILVGLAGHAALKTQRRLEAAERQRQAAIAEARRKRLAAFAKREHHRSAFVELVAAALEERARLQTVLAHVVASDPAERGRLAAMERWLERRLQALDAKLGPVALDISVRHAEIDFAEPPAEATERWYYRDPELHLWAIDHEQGQAHGVDELDWAIAEGLIADPGAAAPEAPPEAASGAGAGEGAQGA